MVKVDHCHGTSSIQRARDVDHTPLPLHHGPLSSGLTLGRCSCGLGSWEKGQSRKEVGLPTANAQKI